MYVGVPNRTTRRHAPAVALQRIRLSSPGTQGAGWVALAYARCASEKNILERKNMNFKDNEKKIKNLLHEQTIDGKFHGARGVYVWSRDYSDTVMKFGVSYGRAGIYNRLRSYKICYPFPSEYFIHMLIITPTGDDARALEKKMLNAPNFRKLERNPNYPREYRIVSSFGSLFRVVDKIMRDDPDLWTHVVVFNGDCWVTVNREEFSKGKHMSRPRKTNCRGMKENIF